MERADAADEELSAASTTVDVNPIARDEEIRRRLSSVLEVTGWFADSQVQVRQGVVFLDGTVASEELKNWAGDLARRTQDVVAVANRMEVADPSLWDFDPARQGSLELWRSFLRSIPLLAFGVCILGLSAGGASLAARAARVLLRRRIQAQLLLTVLSRGIGALVFLFGVYVVLRVAGLTQLALTVVGGTGLVGLAVGIAFRDITENFLASIFLSMQRPFKTGDLIEVADALGYVQQLNVRTTVLMTLAGNVVQIPNATVYKSNLRNFTANCNRREDFEVGIGFDESISEAQEIARAVLAEHPAVLRDPEPWVLVDSLGKATINLRIYFWLNGREHSWLKVRSSVIRLIKLAFQEHGISMPDEAREVVFPKGVPVALLDTTAAALPKNGLEERPSSRAAGGQATAPSTEAEGGLASEAMVIEKQARQAEPVDDAANLLQTRAGEEPGYLAGSAKNPQGGTSSGGKA